MADPDPELDVPLSAPAEAVIVPSQEPEPKPEPVRRSGLPAVIGGAVAAVFGFGLAQVVPGGWPSKGTDAIEAMVAQQAATVAELQAELTRLGAELQSRPATDPALAERLAAIEAAIPAPYDDASIESRIDALETRMTAIAAIPADGSGVSAATIAALQADVAALREGAAAASPDVTAAAEAAEARLAEAEQRAEALRAEAEADAARAETRSALRQIDVALETGGPFASALSAFDAAAIPAVLSDNAATGLPTITDLQASFPDAARMALEESLHANMGESWSERVGSFLRSQTGARSLTPREGDDPDAVLSRVEAILAEGRAADALTELAGLPPEGLAAMADWSAQVQLHLDGLDAVRALRAAVGGE
jgi:hypothetical protein